MDELTKSIVDTARTTEEFEESFRYYTKLYDGADKLLPHKKILYISEYEMSKMELMIS